MEKLGIKFLSVKPKADDGPIFEFSNGYIFHNTWKKI